MSENASVGHVDSRETASTSRVVSDSLLSPARLDELERLARESLEARIDAEARAKEEKGKQGWVPFRVAADAEFDFSEAATEEAVLALVAAVRAGRELAEGGEQVSVALTLISEWFHVAEHHDGGAHACQQTVCHNYEQRQERWAAALAAWEALDG